MIRRWLLRRSVARTAVAGMSVGLAALTALIVWQSEVNHDTTARVRMFSEVSARWSAVSSSINAQHAALNDFLANGGSAHRREPLVERLNGAEPYLRWLERHGGDGEASAARMTRFVSADYNEIVEDILDVAGRGQSLSGYGELASLSFARLSGQVVANVKRWQQDLAAYLEDVDRQNATLRSLAIGLVAFDVSLCLLSVLVLVGYQRQVEQEVTRQRNRSLHDPLTGLANRELLAECVASALHEARAPDPDTRVCFMLVDLDRFKAVNDTLGHQAGDVLLQRVAGRLGEVARQNDTVARIGGDEFVLLLPCLRSAADVRGIAERVRDAIQQPVEIDGVPVDFGASIGVSLFPTDCSDAEGLMRHADMAMYVAKRGGLGISIYHSGGDHGFSEDQLAIEQFAKDQERRYSEPCRLAGGSLTGRLAGPNVDAA